MKVTFNTLPEFIELLENRDLSSEQICEVLEKGFKIFGDESLSPQRLKDDLIKYWHQNQYKKDKPVFLDENINVDEYLESQIKNKRDGFLTIYKSKKAAKISSLFYTSGMSENTIFILGKAVIDFK